MAEEIFETEKEHQRQKMGDKFAGSVWDNDPIWAEVTKQEIEDVLRMLSRHWGRIPAKRVPDAIQLITMIAENTDAPKHKGS